MELLVLLLVAGGIVYAYWWMPRHREAKFHERKRKRVAEIMAGFGADPETREANIHTMFRRKDHVLGFYESDSWHKSIPLTFRLSRHVATLQPQEAAALRVAYVLHNRGLMQAETCNDVHLGIAWGNGKASVDGVHYESTQVFQPQDSQDAIRKYLDGMSVSTEGMISVALAALERAPSNLPVVQALRRELTGGGNAWLSAQEVPQSPYASATSNPYRLRLGRLTDHPDGAMLEYAGEGSLITIAPPGSGKTQCQVLPNLALWPGPALVLDVKGELFRASQRARSAFGPVYRFNPLEPESSHCFNPLAFVRGHPDYVWEDSAFLADMLVVQSKSGDQFWDKRAHGILTAIIADTCYRFEPEHRSMDSLHAVVNRVDWDEFVARLVATTDVRSMAEEGSSLMFIEAKTLDGVLQTLKTSVSPWAGERVRRATKRCDWTPEGLRASNGTVYICLKTGEIATYASVLRVFVAMHLRRLMSTLPPSGTVPILFLLDEMPQMQYMPPVVEAIEVGRQYGIKLWMVAQTEGQIEKHYPDPRSC